MLSRLCAPFSLVALLAAPAAAQTGAFADGELLVRISDLGPDTLYRIDPATGNAAALITDLVGGYSGPAWMAFDGHRGGVLAYTARFDSGISNPRLLLLREDGGVTDLIGPHTGFIRGLTPVGDGRVYLFQGTTLKVLGADNSLTTVLDHLGQPITLALQHMAYDPGTDSLIGVPSAQSTTAPCDGFQQISIHKLPLAAGGLQLSGPITCSSASTFSLSPIGLDPLPGGSGGDLLLTFGDKHQFNANSMLAIDPVTLTTSVWASTTINDLNGGVWAQTINKAVVWDDRNNVLRTHVQGQTGEGTILPTSITVGGQTTGVSMTNGLADVDFQGPACTGQVLSFGTGLAGSGGFVPSLGVANCPTIGQPLNLTVSNALGGRATILVMGLTQIAAPLWGGTLYVLPPFPVFRVAALTPGSSADGFAQIDVNIPNDPGFIGLSVYGQAAVVDPNAVQGVAFTQGIEVKAQ